MTTSTIFRPPVNPVRGVCRWAKRIGPDSTSGLLYIDGQLHGVHELKDDAGKIVGYCMGHGKGENRVYHKIDITWARWECDCPDFIYRRHGMDRGGCKHVRALKAALAAVARK